MDHGWLSFHVTASGDQADAIRIIQDHANRSPSLSIKDHGSWSNDSAFSKRFFFEVETLLIRSSRLQLLPCKEASSVSHLSSAFAVSSRRSMFWDDVSHGHGCLWYDGWYGLWRLRWLWRLWRLWHDGCQMLRRS